MDNLDSLFFITVFWRISTLSYTTLNNSLGDRNYASVGAGNRRDCGYFTHWCDSYLAVCAILLGS